MVIPFLIFAGNRPFHQDKYQCLHVKGKFNHFAQQKVNLLYS